MILRRPFFRTCCFAHSYCRFIIAGQYELGEFRGSPVTLVRSPNIYKNSFPAELLVTPIRLSLVYDFDFGRNAAGGQALHPLSAST